jgi:plasmid replication initiation protein/DNA-directed RNA polymerase subunit RPC12/RpoP
VSEERMILEVKIDNINKNNKKLVSKSNYLVEARPRQRLTVNEAKLIALLISMIHPDDEDFKAYRFKVSDLATLWGLDKKHSEKDKNLYKDASFYNEVREITNSLREKAIDIYSEETNSYLNTGWLSASEYFVGRGYIELEFSPRLKPYLLQQKERFTSYILQNYMSLHSSYSMKIYELLKRHEYKNTKKIRIEFEEVRKILGIKPDEYKRYNDFKRYVLLVAYKEIPQKTDISFEFKEIKIGRKITAIEFAIYPNPDWNKDAKPKPLPYIKEVPEEKEIKGIFFCLSCQKKFDKYQEQKNIDGLFVPVCPYCQKKYIIETAKVPLTPKALKEFLKFYKPEKLFKTIDIVDFQKRKGQKIESYQKYLMTLLVKGVIEPEGYKEPEERLKEELERKKALEEERKKKHAEEKQLKLGRKVRDYIKKLPSDELEALTEQAIKQIEQPMQEALKSKKTDDLTKSLAELNLKVQMEIVIQETVFKEEI